MTYPWEELPLKKCLTDAAEVATLSAQVAALSVTAA